MDINKDFYIYNGLIIINIYSLIKAPNYSNNLLKKH